MRFRNIALSLLTGASLLLTSCGGGGATISNEDARLGAQQHPRLLAEFGGAYGGSQADHVAQLGGKLAKVAGLNGQCTFTLVNSDVVNAFAVPGCYIYVTRGLLSLVESDAELAAVLAHELGHITGRHSNRQQRNSMLRRLGVIAINIVTDSPKLTQMAGAAAELFDLRYSRSHEYEADDLGLKYLIDAGYDPYASARMLEALQRFSAFQAQAEADARAMPEWALTHPLTENRIARARGAAENSGIKPEQLPTGEADYLRAVNGLLYGDDPEQGFIIGRTFEHPVMRIAFTAPQGFSLANSPTAVLIDGPDGLRGEFAGGPMPAAGPQAYAEALLSAILGNAPARIDTAAPARIGGTLAFIVQASVATGQGEAPISIAVYAGEQGQAYHFVLISKPGAPPPPRIADLFASFHLLTPEQAAQLRPRFIQVKTVETGDTIGAFAQAMATDRPLETFRMINAIRPSAGLRPGEAVKVVRQAPLLAAPAVTAPIATDPFRTGA